MPSNASEALDPSVDTSSPSTHNIKDPIPILVVDDDLLLRSMLENVLSGWGYACVVAPDGITALTHLSQYSIKLVITDYQMPGLDGLELLQRLRAQHPSIPVIIFSGEPAPELPAKAISMGAFAWLFKPMDINGLRKMVRKAIKYGEASGAGNG